MSGAIEPRRGAFSFIAPTRGVGPTVDVEAIVAVICYRRYFPAFTGVLHGATASPPTETMAPTLNHANES